MKNKKAKKILLTGGGTGGATTPLLAMAETLQRQEPTLEFLFMGTPDGPEKGLVKKAGIPFFSMRAAKLRRYFDLRNLTDLLFRFPLSVLQALRFVLRHQPQLLVSVGGFVSVPFAIVCKFLHIPILIHQQDLRPGLANRIMAPLATKITVSFAPSLKRYPPQKTILTGNPVRTQIVNSNPDRARALFNVLPSEKVMVIMGGGTGALVLNEYVADHLAELTKLGHVVHLTGKGKYRTAVDDPRYHGFEFLSKEMGDVLALADVVVSRAGIASLTELAALGKACIFIPIPQTHQEENAKFIQEHQAGLVFEQTEIDNLPRHLHRLLTHPSECEKLERGIRSVMPEGANQRVAEQLLSLLP